MKGAKMDEKLLSQIISFIKVMIWPTIVIVAIMMFKNEFKAIIKRFTSADDLQMSIGSLTVQAKAMREINDTIGTSFPEKSLNKAELKALIDTKIRSVQAAVEYHIAKSNIRTDDRIVVNEKIIITTDDGEEFKGEILDMSKAGISFKSSKHLRFHEIVRIEPYGSEKNVSILNEVIIVRVEHSEGAYYYGAEAHNKL